jgi:tetratricopeptide (TPR) repeat protein
LAWRFSWIRAPPWRITIWQTALFDGEDFAAAETEFRQALRLQPSAENHYYLSACLMSLGRYDAALPELEAAVRLQPATDLYRMRRQELLKLMRASNRH